MRQAQALERLLRWWWWGSTGAHVRCLLTSSASLVEETSASQDDSDNSVSESLDDCDYSVAEISRSFRSQQELCEQLNINHMIQRIFLITLDNSEFGGINGQNPGWVVLRWRGATRWQFLIHECKFRLLSWRTIVDIIQHLLT